MKGYFDGLKNHYESNYDVWKHNNDACVTAENDAVQKDAECDTIQRQFETRFCLFRVEMHTTCAEYVGCYANAQEEFSELVASTGAAEETRQLEWTAIQKIKCYIAVLVSDDTTDDRKVELDKCEQLEPDASALKLEDPPLDEQETCNLSPVANFPCSAKFVSEHYLDMTGLLDCQACPALPGHIDTENGHTCRTVEDSYEDWSNTKHAAKDGIVYMGGFDRGQQTVTKSFDLIPGVQYKLSVVLDTWASVDNEPMKIKAAEKELTVQSRAHNVCNNGWTAYPAGTGRFLGSSGSGAYDWQDCWKNVELMFTAPASGKTHVEMYSGIDQHANDEAWGWHDLKLEPLNCPPQASGEDEEVQEAFPAREGDEEEVAQWNLVCRQSNDFWFHKDQWSLNSGDPENANFAILDQLESFRRDGRFVFKLRWPNNDFEDQVWSQTSNPVTSQGGGVQGYQVISAPYTEQNWGGLEYNNGAALLDGSVNSGHWWYAVGSFQKFSSGIPGPNHIVADAVELWVQASSSEDDKQEASPAKESSFAGNYFTYIRGKRNRDAVMSCDGGIEIEHDGLLQYKGQLRTEGVREKCSQARDAKAIYYVMYQEKYECLWPEGHNLVGSLYTDRADPFWGTMEYRQKSQTSC
jgi:hypothetical protein